MYKNPVYHFDTTTETGIDQVPMGALVFIKDVGLGKSRQVQKIDDTGLDSTSTIQDFLDDTNLHTEPVPDNTVTQDQTGTVSAAEKIWVGTRTDYDNLGTYDNAILYFIKEA